MTNLISDSLASALIEQVGHERYNATLYIYVAAFLKNKGFENIAKHFEGQHDEEIGHSKIIIDLMTDLNTHVKLVEVGEVDIPFNTIVDIATAYLEREIQTTTSLDSIKHLAEDEGNPVVEERLREMIKLQQNEYAEATDFVDKSELCGSDWSKVLLWDLSLK
jgi:ferritin